MVSYKKTDENGRQQDEAIYENNVEIIASEGGVEEASDYSDNDLYPADLIAFAWQVSRGMVCLCISYHLLLISIFT